MSSLLETLSTENIVGTTSIDQEVNLEALSEDLDGVSYEPARFPGLIFRTQEPKAASLIFRSGKIVNTGAESIEAMSLSIQQTFDTLRDLGLELPPDPEITIQNIVTSGDLGKPLHLNAVAIGFGLEYVEYEPEQFPGLVYRADDLDVVLLLFGSGKIVITGGTHSEDAEQAIESVATRLEELDLLQ